MGKESVVEIPLGSGNKYRYAYIDGDTKYLGPVGDAPELGETEFLKAVQILDDWPEMEHTLKEMIRTDATTREWYEFFKANYLPSEFDDMLKGYEDLDPDGEKRIHTGTKAYPLITDKSDEHTFEVDPGFNHTYVMTPIGSDEIYIVGESKHPDQHEECKIVTPINEWNFMITNKQEFLDYVKRSWAGKD